MKKSYLLGAVCVCFSLSFASPVFSSTIELITNGGFETGDFTGWSQPSVNSNPWSIVSDKSYTGGFSAFNPALPSAAAATTLFQSFSPTQVDNIVTAGFWYFHVGGTGSVGLATALKFSDGTSDQDTLFADDPSYQKNVWAYRDLTQTLLANPGKQLVEIGFFPKLWGSQYVDDVSIRAIPLPPAAYLFGSGVLGLIGIARKKVA